MAWRLACQSFTGEWNIIIILDLVQAMNMVSGYPISANGQIAFFDASKNIS